MRHIYIFVVIATIISTVNLTCHAENHEDRRDIIRKQFLDPQNEARAKVGVQPLKWSNTLTLYAENFAKRVCDGPKNDRSPKSGGPYGENTFLYAGGTAYWTALLWVEESLNYNHHTNTCNNGHDCSHYTQVVWRDTVNVGCAFTFCEALLAVAVCEYYPPGNVPGQWPY